MGVYCDRLIGHRMIVTKEYFQKAQELAEKFDDEEIFFEAFCEGKNNSLINPKLTSLGFVPYYANKRPKQGNTTLIVDTLNGEYAWLVHIFQADYFSEFAEDELTYINEAVGKQPVPKDIRNKMNKIYTLLFGGECNQDTKLQHISHWH